MQDEIEEQLGSIDNMEEVESMQPVKSIKEVKSIQEVKQKNIPKNLNIFLFGIIKNITSIYTFGG